MLDGLEDGEVDLGGGRESAESEAERGVREILLGPDRAQNVRRLQRRARARTALTFNTPHTAIPIIPLETCFMDLGLYSF